MHIRLLLAMFPPLCCLIVLCEEVLRKKKVNNNNRLLGRSVRPCIQANTSQKQRRDQAILVAPRQTLTPIHAWEVLLRIATYDHECLSPSHQLSNCEVRGTVFLMTLYSASFYGNLSQCEGYLLWKCCVEGSELTFRLFGKAPP